MCGIAGAVALTPGARPDEARIRRISHLLAHRGPDGEGFWTSPSGAAFLAHRRLSIIDLACGGQPMMAREGRLGLVFNGEIYNYKERRAVLAQRGAQFSTASDTEVLLRDFERRGVSCVEDLRGFFAFAFWDDDARRLTLARDRIGKKPLYYVVDGGCLYFASSVAVLRETAPTPYKLNVSAVDEYLTLGYVPAPETVYEGVRKMEAGTILEADADGVRVRKFWDLAEAESPFGGTYEQAVDQLDELVNTSVALRLRSDVPLGVFLSGGIDSSLVAAVATRQSSERVLTFSIGMDVAAFDESVYAGQVAERLGTEHRLFRAHPDLLGTLPSMVWHYGEPFADSSALPTWMLSQHTRKHVTVAVGGDGGDEGFAGYAWYRTAYRLKRLSRAIPAPAFAAAGSALGGMMRAGLPLPAKAAQARRGLRMLGVPHGPKRFAAQRSFLNPAEAESLFAGALLASRRATGDLAGSRLARLYRAAEGTDLRRMRYVDMATYLADCLMPKVDVASMANSLEVRAPLLDQEIVRFAMSLPDEWLLAPDGGKRILRDVLYRYLPKPLFDRPKQGFSIPLKRWFADDARDVVAALSRSPALMDTGWFNGGAIDALVAEHAAGARDHSDRLYSLLFLDRWLAARA
jgi:asparagine synthase (glutamine-hydrolysing)